MWFLFAPVSCGFWMWFSHILSRRRRGTSLHEAKISTAYVFGGIFGSYLCQTIYAQVPWYPTVRVFPLVSFFPVIALWGWRMLGLSKAR